MHRFILSVTIAISLAAAAGCGARAAHPVAAPSGAVADLSKDPSWCPPGQMEVSYGETPASAGHAEEATVIKPNATERPNIGAVHAAVY